MLLILLITIANIHVNDKDNFLAALKSVTVQIMQ